MKTKILTLVLPFVIVGALMTSCDEKSKESKQVEKDMVETNRKIEERAEELRVEARKDWESFKASSEEALDKREEDIKDLRAEIAKADKKQREKLNKDLDNLEQKNRELKDRIATRTNTFKEDMADFNEKAMERHKEAQRELKHDMDELGKSINNFFKKNTD